MKRLSSMYVSGVLMLANTLVLFIVLNAVAYAILSVLELGADDEPVSEQYGEERLAAVYPGLDGREIERLLEETWSRPYVYEPFTQFREGPYQGQYVNIDAHGFRRGRDQATWPPPVGDVNLFLIGGSTTFGYGVADDQTIASHLQGFLRDALGPKVNVYNFGRGFYYSTQERILFETLLAAGHVPDLAVFVDGLNEFYHYDGVPRFTGEFSRYVSQDLPEVTFTSKLPIVRLIARLRGDVDDETQVLASDSGNVRYDDAEVLRGVIRRFFENRKIVRAVADAYGVQTLFVWQPVPTYNYDTAHHLFAYRGFGRHLFSKHGYAMMREHVDEQPPGPDFLWAADLQQGLDKPLYVDRVHYTAEFSGVLARHISEHIVQHLFRNVGAASARAPAASAPGSTPAGSAAGRDRNSGLAPPSAAGASLPP